MFSESGALQKAFYAGSNLLPYGTHRLDGLAFGIGQRPIFAAKAGHVRTSFSAAHRHQQRRLSGQCFAQELRADTTQVNANFVHDRLHFGMNAIAWLGTC